MNKLSVLGIAALALLLAGSVAQAVDVVASPSTVSLTAKGQWLTVHVEVPFSAVETVSAEVAGSAVPIEDTKSDLQGNLVLKILLDDVLKLLQPGTAEVAVSGTLGDETTFSGSDTIKVVRGQR